MSKTRNPGRANYFRVFAVYKISREICDDQDRAGNKNFEVGWRRIDREITGRGKDDVDIDTWSERITSMLHNGMDWHDGNDDDSEPA